MTTAFRGGFPTAIMLALVLSVALTGSAPIRSAVQAAQGKMAPPDLVTPGTLTYGTAATFAPFEYRENDKYAGFDIEMGQALANYMGLQVKIVDLTFDGLIPALKGKRIDIINSAMYIKPERAKQVDFLPYMRIGNAILVPKGNPKHVKSLDDLSGLTVAVTRGAIEEIYAVGENKRLKGMGKPEIHILALPTAQDSVLATQQGRADAFFDSTPGAAFLMKKLPGTFTVAGIFELKTEIGIAVRKGDTAMRSAVEAALRKFVADGSYKRLLAKYDLAPESSLFK
jgi:polar amino acid transport system substrate-binding protein